MDSHSSSGLDQTLVVAMNHHREGRLNLAEPLYRRILETHPQQPEVLHLLGILAHQTGRNDLAAVLIEKAIALDNTKSLYHYHLGEVYRTSGNYEPAIASYRRALSLQPRLADVSFNLGNALFELGRFEDATRVYKRALGLAPADAEIHNNLGNALAAQGRLTEASHCYRQALERQPRYAKAWANLGAALNDQGRFEEAIACYRRAVALAPELAEAHTQLGRLLKGQGRLEEALSSFRQAARWQADSARAVYDLGTILEELGWLEEALGCLRKAVNLDPGYAEAYGRLGHCLSRLGRFEEALENHRKALSIHPNSAGAHFHLGICLQSQGRFDEAIGCHQAALSLRPELAEAHYHLAANKSFSADDEYIDQLKQRLARPGLSADARINLNFALAKIYDQRNWIDQAFSRYHAANTLKAGLAPFDPAAYSDHINRLIATFNAEFFARRDDLGGPSELPIFIIGMPRSGSTLVEQIIASHPQIAGGGELDDLRRMVREIPRKPGVAATYPECVPWLDQEHFGQLATGYLDSLRQRAPEAVRVTDKMLGNYLRLGLIAVLFPRARVIHCRRDPLDTCLSCYFQNFAHGLRFTYDLGHLGLVYQEYERLMAHWRRVLTLPVLEVSYEELISQPEAVSRRLIEFCGLAWDERCLDFHRQDRHIYTASFWQARQPIYTTSLGRWRAYEKYLTPLIDSLG